MVKSFGVGDLVTSFGVGDSMTSLGVSGPARHSDADTGEHFWSHVVAQLKVGTLTRAGRRMCVVPVWLSKMGCIQEVSF